MILTQKLNKFICTQSKEIIPKEFKIELQDNNPENRIQDMKVQITDKSILQ
jgi:hypothetical protein